MSKGIPVLEIDDLIGVLINAYNKNSNILNAAIRRVYAYSKSLESVDDEEKKCQLLLMLNNEHVYVKYWGSVIALSHKILKKLALTTLISILDISPMQEGGTLNLSLNVLKMNIETVLYDYKKYRCIGSYPGQYSYEPSVLPNARWAIRYFRNYIKRK
jgi:hypothetical protein